MVTKILFFCFICFISFKSIAQNKDEKYEFESIVYTPTQEILRIMDEDMIACFNGLDINLSKMQHHLQIFKRNDSLIMSLNTSPKVITDIAVEWDGLKIKGIFYYQDRLVIIEADDSELYVINRFFKKTCKRIKTKIELNKYGEPSCGGNYLIDYDKLIFLERFSLF